MTFQGIYFIRFTVKNTNGTYTTVQGAARGKPGVSLPAMFCSVIHQKSNSAANAAEYTMETTLSTGNKRAGRFIVLKYYSVCSSISSSINRELEP